jgi:hypothetical protein
MRITQSNDKVDTPSGKPIGVPTDIIPGHDYSRNYQNLNLYGDNARYDGPKDLPDWYLNGAKNANFTRGYYFPIPLEDRIHRNKVKPENENAHILRIQNWHKERDPWYDQMSTFNNLYNYGPGHGPRFGQHAGSSEDTNRMPEILVGEWSAQPLTYREHEYYPTREEKYREREPENTAIDMVPRAMIGEQVLHPRTHMSADNYRKKLDRVEQDRINTNFRDIYQNEHKANYKYQVPALLKNKPFDQREQVPEIQGQYKDTYANLVSRSYETAKPLRDHCERRYDGRDRVSYDKLNRNGNADPKGLYPRRERTGSYERLHEPRLSKPVHGNDYTGKEPEQTRYAKNRGKNNHINNVPDYNRTYLDRIDGQLGFRFHEPNNVSKKIPYVQNAPNSGRRLLADGMHEVLIGDV